MTYCIIRYEPDPHDKVSFAYRSVKAARKALYEGLKSRPEIMSGTILEFRDHDPSHGKRIGVGYRSPFGIGEKSAMFMVVTPETKIHIRYRNLESKARTPPEYLLKADGSLGKKL